jgi:hypothetical protein
MVATPQHLLRHRTQAAYSSAAGASDKICGKSAKAVVVPVALEPIVSEISLLLRR